MARGQEEAGEVIGRRYLYEPIDSPLVKALACTYKRAKSAPTPTTPQRSGPLCTPNSHPTMQSRPQRCIRQQSNQGPSARSMQRGPQQQQPHNVRAHSAHFTATQVCKVGPNALFVSAAVVVFFVSATVVGLFVSAAAVVLFVGAAAVVLFVSAAVVVEHDHAVVPALTAVHHCGALSLRFEVQEEVVTEQFHVVDGLF